MEVVRLHGLGSARTVPEAVRLELPCAFLASLMLVSAPVAAVHRWIDEAGNVHYGNHAPPAGGSEPVPLRPPPTDEDVRQARERSERVEQRLGEFEKARAIESASDRAQPGFRRVPLVVESRFRCAPGGVVSVGDSIQTLLRKCGPPRSKHVVPEADSGGVAGLLVWRYEGYGDRRVVIEGETVRRIEREAIQSRPRTERRESWLERRSDYYDDQLEKEYRRRLREEHEERTRERQDRERSEPEERDGPTYHRAGAHDHEGEEQREPEERDGPTRHRVGR